MRLAIIFIFTLFATSCDNKDGLFDKLYYEKVTGIKFPARYKVLETFDNGEWLTGSVIKMDSLTLTEFVFKNHFDKIINVQEVHLLAESYLKENKLNLTSNGKMYFISKSVNKNNWTFVADLNSYKLWTEISYPDWGGK